MKQDRGSRIVSVGDLKVAIKALSGRNVMGECIQCQQKKCREDCIVARLKWCLKNSIA